MDRFFYIVLVLPIIVAGFFGAAGTATAQPADRDKVDRLFVAAGMPEIIAIMRQEGLEFGAQLADDMLPGGRSGDWNATVARIYDRQTMVDDIQAAFAQALEGDEIDAMLAFYTSTLGTLVVGLEIEARRALLDEDVADASIEAAALARIDMTPRFLLAQEFIKSNDLVDANVVGALNSSYAFYTGLIDGGAMPAGVTAETALQDVWSQEAQLRQDATEWIYSFVLMAYQPLSEDELNQMLAFSQTPAGQSLTNALFVSFNATFDDISRKLGLAASQFLVSQRL